MDDGGGKGELFLHAVGEIGDEFLWLVGEVHEVEELVGALVGGIAFEAVHASDEAKIFRRSEAAEEGEAFGKDADLTFDVEGVGGEVDAEEVDAAGGGSKEAGEHLDGGGFAGTVGAEESKELTGGDVEGDIVDSGEGPEAAGEVAEGDCGRVHWSTGYRVQRAACRVQGTESWSWELGAE